MRWWADLPGKLLGPMFTLDAVRVGRRTSTFVTRWLYLGGLVVILFMFFWGWTNRNELSGRVEPSVLARFAEEFFWVYAVTQFLVVVALTPAFTAAAITDEKERKTLDFLLVTDLSTREIVFGKLASRAGMLFTLVLAGLPILSLVQFFGGIDPELLLIAAGMTLATVVSMAAVGMACSVQLVRTRDAVVLAYVLPLIYVVASSMWADAAGAAARAGRDWSVQLFGYTGTGDSAAQAVAAGNPFRAWAAINGRTAAAANSGATFGWYVWFHAMVAAIGFAFAALRLRGAARAAGGGVAARGKVRRFFARLGGHRTTARPHPAVTDQPVAWREVYVDSGSGVLRVLLRFLVVAVIAWSFLNAVGDTLLGGQRYSGTYGPWEAFQSRTKVWVGGVTGGLGVLMMLGATVRGAGSVAGEKDRDTWTNLLTAPLTAGEILRGKWWGSIWGQRHAVYVMAAVWAIGVLTGSVNPIPLVLAALAFAVYLAAFAWLGVSCSVNARTARAAITRAVPHAIFYGGGFWLFLGCCCVAGASGGGGGELVGHMAAFVLGFTPPFVLGGLPFLDAKLFHDMGRGGTSYFLTLLFGGAVGTCAWAAVSGAYQKRAHELMQREANRDGFERPSLGEPPDLPPDDPPRPLDLGAVPPLPPRPPE